MFCKNCGKEVERDTKYCKYCGKEIDMATEGIESPSIKPSSEVEFKTVDNSSKVAGNTKKFSPALFALIIILFFLPFLTVNCSGTKVANLTGIQLVTGTTVSQPSTFDQTNSTQKEGSEPWAIVAFVLAFIGLALSFLKSFRSAIAPAIVGAFGAISLLLLKMRIDNEVFTQGQGSLQAEYQAGFWLVFLCFILASIINAFIFSRREKDVEKYPSFK